MLEQEQQYSDIAVYTSETVQIVVRVADPTDPKQVNTACRAVVYGLIEVCSLEGLQALRPLAAYVIDALKAKRGAR